MLHAVGAAWAAKLKSEKVITMTGSGDGATSKGDFHEAMNFAGVFKTGTNPSVRTINMPFRFREKLQTASETIAQKAVAYGFDGIQVDGNDLFAVMVATKETLRARPVPEEAPR